MRYHKITYPDVNNGRGCRVTLWLAGCSHHCPHCHNPQTWDFKGGRTFTPEAKSKLLELLSLPYIDGLTLSGGDPADSAEDVVQLCQDIKRSFPDKSIWLYTGYTMEKLKTTTRLQPLLSCGIDTIVDGPYIHEQRDISLPFRGSSNQKIWTVRMDGSFRVMDDAEFTRVMPF